MKILGLASETHDTGLALIEDGIPTLVIEEERLNREKHTLDFPFQALELAFGAGQPRAIGDIDLITVPWDVWRLRRTFLTALAARFPASLTLLRPSAHTTQDSGVAILNFWMGKDLRTAFPGRRLPKIVNVGHHESHAAIAFVSPFEDATVLVMDGYGDDAATSGFTLDGSRLTRHWHGRFFDSLGMVYTLMTCHLGFQPFEEGTVMALAACGDDSYVARLRDLIHLTDGGQFRVNKAYFSYDTYGMIRPFKPKLIDMLGPARRKDEPLNDRHRAIARGLQSLAEDVVIHTARHLAKTHPSRNLVFTGGVALNCVANARILRDTDFKRVWVPPCASDTGAPLGSALWHHHQTLGQSRHFELTHAFYGPQYSDAEIKSAFDAAGIAYEEMQEGDLIARVAKDLAANKIVGWYQGRFEMGPRALGNRSILASPLSLEIKEIINTRVKYREPFRPFAPAVLQEYASEYFEVSQPDPFMTLAPRVRPDKVATIPAAVHVDGTGRIQTVDRAANPRYYGVIEAFMKLTGVPVLLNTSFNKQEPIVARPQEAISCFLRTQMDVLVLGNCYATQRDPAAVARAEQAFKVLEINTRGGE